MAEHEMSVCIEEMNPRRWSKREFAILCRRTVRSEEPREQHQRMNPQQDQCVPKLLLMRSWITPPKSAGRPQKAGCCKQVSQHQE